MSDNTTDNIKGKRNIVLSIGMFILGASTLVGYQAILAGVFFFNNFIPKAAGKPLLSPAKVITANQLGFFIFPIMLVLENLLGIWMKIVVPLGIQFIVSVLFYLLLSKSLSTIHIYILSFLIGITQNMLQNGVFGWIGVMPLQVLLVTFVGQTFIGVFISSVKIGLNNLENDSLKLIIYTVSWELVLIAAITVFILMSKIKETKKYYNDYIKLSNKTNKNNKKTFKEQMVLTKEVFIKLKAWICAIFVNMFTSFLLWPSNLAIVILHKKGGEFEKSVIGIFPVTFGLTIDYIIFSYNYADFASRLISLLELNIIKQAFSSVGIGIWLAIRIVSLLLLPLVGFIQNYSCQRVCIYIYTIIFGVINGFSINFIMSHGSTCKSLKDEEKQVAGHLMVTFLVFGLIIGAISSPIYKYYIFGVLGVN